MAKKIILSIFPKFYWLTLIFGFFIRYIDEFLVLSNIVLIIIFTLFFVRIGVVLHEIGHLLFAKIVGGNPKRIILGKGHEVIKYNFFKVKIIINNQFKGGFAFANFNNTSFIKLKHFIYILGGAFTNLVFAYVCYKFFGLNFQSYSGEYGIDISTAFITSNVFLAVFSLIPYYTDFNGVKIATDGLSILKLPFQKSEELKSNINMDEFFTACEYFEVKEYGKATNIFEKYLKNEETELISKIYLSLIYLRTGEIEKGYKICVTCLDLVADKKKKNLKAYVNNNLAWFCLIKQDFKNAEYYSKVAFSINHNEPNFRGTRGAVLIEMGNVKKGLDLLKPLIDFKFPNSQTLCAAMYFYYGLFLNDKKGEKYLAFLENNIEKLDFDERILWNNIKIRCEEITIHNEKAY